MKYALLIYGEEGAWENASAEERRAVYDRYDAFGKEAEARGIIRGGEELRGTDTATTVRVRNGETMVTDGPFAETKEQLGGFFLLECESVDEALEMAAKIPGAENGAIEVRPVVTQDDHAH
jgi:hypothetical protein